MDQDKNGLIERLISITAALIEVMNRELEFLNNMQPEEIRDLQAEKQDLAKAYEGYMLEIKSNPALLAQCEDSVKHRLEKVTAMFNSTLSENERALRAVKSVSERLLGVIVNAVAEKQAGAAYSSTGAMGASALAAGKPLPFAVNQSL
jgi:fatty acid/phospholipid biosynthesis enzyme